MTAPGIVTFAAVFFPATSATVPVFLSDFVTTYVFPDTFFFVPTFAAGQTSIIIGSPSGVSPLL